MQGINWGFALPQQNALANMGQNIAQGYQFGQQIQQQRRAEETRNALAGYAANPSEQGLAGLAQYAPEFVIGERQRMAGEQAAAAQAAQEAQAEQMEQMREVVGQAALRIANLPPEARAAAWDSAIQGLSPQFPQLAQYRGQYSEQSLYAAIDAAGLVNDYYTQSRPRYQVIPQGAVLVNTNDPSATTEFAQGGPQPTSATPPNLGSVMAFSDYQRVIASLPPNRRADYAQRAGVVIQVQSVAEANQLPEGTPYRTPNGQEYIR